MPVLDRWKENIPSQDERTFRPRRSSAVSIVAALLLLMTLGACGRIQQSTSPSEANLQITLTTDPAPPVMGSGKVIVSLRDGTGNPVDDAEIEVEGNMSHAGMVPSTGSAHQSLDGVYEIPLQWTMGGDWFVDVKVKLPDGQQATERFPVTVGAANN